MQEHSPQPQLIDYIRRSLEQGIPRERIAKSLSDQGWPEEQIALSFMAVELPEEAQDMLSPEKMEQVRAAQQAMARKMSCCLGGGCATIGLLFIIGFAFALQQTRHLISEGNRVIGKVSEVEQKQEEDCDEDGRCHMDTYYRPHIRYEVDGDGYEWFPESWSSKSEFAVGKNVPLLYDADNPVVAEVERAPIAMYAPSVAAIILGLLLFSIGLATIVKGKVPNLSLSKKKAGRRDEKSARK